MTTITFDQEIKIGKTHFKTYNKLKKNLSSNKSLSKNNEKIIGWSDEEINEFEKQNTIAFLNKLEEKEGNINWDEIFIKGNNY